MLQLDDDENERRNMKIVFFGLDFDSLISRQQQRLFCFRRKSLLPQHMTCIIGISDDIPKSICRSIAKSELFENLLSFSYMVPTSFVCSAEERDDMEKGRVESNAMALIKERYVIKSACK